MILELLLDALLDSVKMLPFLFAAYWLIEYVEHRHSEGIEKALAGGGRFGFVPGAVLGLLPQCGFSAMAANLYASKVVTLGTLLAVFLATSDEAVPLLIANPEHWRSLALILGIKLAVALVAGFCIDFVFKRLIPQSVRGGYTGSSSAVDCHEHEERDGILAAALKHTLHIFLFILLFNIVLGALVALVGEEAIGAFLAASGHGSLCWPGLWGSFPTVCPRSSSPSCMPRASFRWEAWWRGCARAQAWAGGAAARQQKRQTEFVYRGAAVRHRRGGGPGLQPVCIAKSKSTPPHGGVLFARCGQGTGKGRAPYNFRQLPNDTADRLWYNMSGW